MSCLTDEIKLFIVKALARFDSPSEVAEAVRVNFGVVVTRQGDQQACEDSGRAKHDPPPIAA